MRVNNKIFQKYLESGYHCIPIRPKSKATVLSNYSVIDYCKNGITPEMAEEFDNKYSDCGVAILTGDASKVDWLDIDTNDKELIALMPESPIVKIGETGESRAFRRNPLIEFTETIESGNPNKAIKDQIEYLCNNKYTILPPSIHPAGMRYQWAGECEEDIITYDSSKLPLFDLKYLDIAREYYFNKYGTPYEKGAKPAINMVGPFYAILEGNKLRAPHGSQDRLKHLAAILIGKETTAEEGALKLLEYDRENHIGLTYFEDKSRGKDAAADSFTNAIRFYVEVAATINSKRKRLKEIPHNIAPISSFNNKISQQIITETKILNAMPGPRGMLKAFVDAANKYTFNDNTNLGFAYGLTYLSMHLGNRFAVKYKQTLWPANIMIFTVAGSGIGKNKPRKFMENLLFSTRVLGSSDYTSSVAILGEFTPIIKDKKNGQKEVIRYPKRELCCVIDEVDGMLMSMARSKDTFETRLPKTIIELFDASRDQFYGQMSKNAGQEGCVHNPYFTFIGSTQPHKFKKAMSGDILYKGFYQRALIFELKKVHDANTFKEPDLELERKMSDFTRSWFDYHKVDVNNFGGTIEEGKANDFPVVYKEIRLTPKAEEYLSALHLEYYNMVKDAHNSGNELKGSVKARFLDNTLKLAQIDWLATMPSKYWNNPQGYFLDVEHLEWAKQVVLAKYEESKPYFDQETVQNNKDEQDMESIFRFIKGKGGRVTGKQLNNGVKVGMSSRRQQLLKELQERGILLIEEERGEGPRPTTYYKAI